MRRGGDREPGVDALLRAYRPAWTLRRLLPRDLKALGTAALGALTPVDAGLPATILRPGPGGSVRALAAAAGLQLLRHRRDMALVTVVFARPGSVLTRELSSGFAYVDDRSGPAWHLYLAGHQIAADGTLTFDPAAFSALRQAVTREIESSTGVRWRYSGGVELVSVMTYPSPGRRSAHIDWASVRCVRLTGSNGEYRELGFDEVVELMSDWEDDPPGLRPLAPGEHPGAMPIGSLVPALTWTAGAVAGGVLGNAASDLLKSLTG